MHVVSQQILVSSRHNKAFEGLEMRQFAFVGPDEDLQMDGEMKDEDNPCFFSPNKNGQSTLSSSLF